MAVTAGSAARKTEQLRLLITKIFEDSDGTYGTAGCTPSWSAGMSHAARSWSASSARAGPGAMPAEAVAAQPDEAARPGRSRTGRPRLHRAGAAGSGLTYSPGGGSSPRSRARRRATASRLRDGRPYLSLRREPYPLRPREQLTSESQAREPRIRQPSAVPIAMTSSRGIVNAPKVTCTALCTRHGKARRHARYIETAITNRLHQDWNQTPQRLTKPDNHAA